MADKRISQLIDRGTVLNNDVIPIVVSGAVTTNKATISSIQTFMQSNLDVGVTSVGITLGSSGTDVNVTGSPVTSSGNITINIPTASATNRGLLSSADWSTFNSKQQAITLTTTGTSGAATLVSGTLNIPNYSTDLSGYVTLGTTQTITAQKTFTTSGSSDTMIISHGSGSGFALDVLKAGNGEAIRVTKTSGSGNAMTISGGNFEAGTIVKTGGTSSQFLKADGSVDSSTYVTTDTNQSITGFKSFVNGFSLASEGGTNQPTTFINTGSIHEGSASTNQIGFNNSNNIYFGKGLNNGGVLQWTNSAVRYYTLPDADGTLALTSDIPSLAGYVTLATTQTITGAKTFDTTTSDFLILNSTNASGGALTFRRNGTNVGHIGNSGVLGVGILDDLEVRSGISRALHLKTDGGKLTLSAGGSVTLDGALNGTSASFTGGITAASGVFNGQILSQLSTGQVRTSPSDSAGMLHIRPNAGSSGYITFTENAVADRWAIGTTNGDGNFYFRPTSPTTSPVVTIASTGAATFSSSVTATNINLSAVNSITVTAGGAIINSTYAGIEGNWITMQNAGGIFYSGLENSVGNSFGATPYAGVLFLSGARNFEFFTGNTRKMTLNSGGDLLVGQNTPTLSSNGWALQQGGTGHASFEVTNNEAFVFNNRTTGTTYQIDFRTNTVERGSISVTDSATSYNTSSDYRLKENVKPVENALSVLTQLKPCTFNFIVNPEDEVMGFLAHEVQEVMPQAIKGKKDGFKIEEVEVSPAELDEEGNIITEAVIEEKEVPVYQGIDHSKLVPLLVAAIQEQQEQIKELTKQIDSLKNQMQ